MDNILHFEKGPIKNKIYRIIVAGETGVGKTYFSLSFPGKTIVVDFENRLSHLTPYYSIDYIRVSDVSDLSYLIKNIKTITKDYDNIVIDSLTSYYNIIQISRMKPGTKENLEMYDWLYVKNNIKELLTALWSANKNIIAISQIKENDKGEQSLDIERNVPFTFDTIVRLELDEKNKRYLKVLKDAYGLKIGSIIPPDPKYFIDVDKAEEPSHKKVMRIFSGSEVTAQKENTNIITDEIKKAIKELNHELGYSDEQLLVSIKRNYNVESIDLLNENQLNEIYNKLSDLKATKDLKSA